MGREANQVTAVVKALSTFRSRASPFIASAVNDKIGIEPAQDGGLTSLCGACQRAPTRALTRKPSQIKGSRIFAVGMTQEILSVAGPKTRRIDLGERLGNTGINNGHVHFDEDPKRNSVQFEEKDQTCVGALNWLRQAVRNTPP